MAWNEPGGNKDPWGGRGGDKGPPDLDEIVRKMQAKMGGLFGGRKGGGGTHSGGNGGGFISLGVIILVAAVVWLLFGFYIVDEGRRGVELRFGQFSQSTMPGLHWHAPYPIETVELVDVEKRRFIEVGYRSTGGTGSSAQQTVPREALMLTQDENIVDIRVAVQYQVKDARDYLFNVRDPDTTLKQATESAIREVIGKSKMDFVLTEGRAEVAMQAKSLIQTTLDQYNAGLLVTTVNLQDAQPPEEVQGAFVDAIKAREDEDRQKQEAQAYSNDIIPKARGAAARILEEAAGYKLSVVAKAEGEASRFTQMLTEYTKAPEVTRKRLYLDTMEEVLANSSKVTVDVSKGNNLLYLPLDQMLQGAAAAAPRAFTGNVGDNSAATSSTPDSRIDSRRSREPR